MRYPYIGLVTACFNHKDYIAETIESVLDQKYPYLRYIVYDDGSTDGSWEVIKQYEKYLYRCERLEGKRDTPTIALNKGFNALPKDVDVIGWLNSDDILLRNSLTTVAEAFMDNEQVQWISGVATGINYRSRVISSRLHKRNKYDYLLGEWQVIQQESTLWRKELFEKAGPYLNEEKKWAFDIELWTRMFEHAEHWHMTAPVGAFRSGKQSMSVAVPESFLKPCHDHLNEMKKRASKKDLFFARIYWFCKKILWPLLTFIPHRYIKKISVLKRYAYGVLEYNFQADRWDTAYQNPFRR